jgi:hypothetical protein
VESAPCAIALDRYRFAAARKPTLAAGLGGSLESAA